jgi:acetolactate synthase-1/2/3 large subunit
MVDIDAGELQKPTLKIDLPIQSDARFFIEELIHQLLGVTLPNRKAWLDWCRGCQAALPTIFEDNPPTPGYANSFLFVKELFDQLPAGSIVVTGNGIAYNGTYQTAKFKPGMRVFSNQGCASMGYDLPAAIGAAVSLPGRDIILITGDGSIQMNIQEMATIAGLNLPIKIFMLDNHGYLSMRVTQNAFFKNQRVGCDSASGVTFPDMLKLAAAYGLPVFEVHEDTMLSGCIQAVLAQPGPVFCKILMNPNQSYLPRQSSRSLPDGRIVSIPLEDMYPFIDRNLFNRLMLIPPFES